MPSKIEIDAREMPQACCLQRDPTLGYYHDQQELVTGKNQDDECPTYGSTNLHTLPSQVRHRF